MRLSNLIGFVFDAHDRCPTEPGKAFRKWDGETPYAVHPCWCAMTLLAEDTLPKKIRQIGAQALLLHDILEDTTARLPEGLEPEVVKLVEEMTFPGGSAQEMVEVWGRSDECKLLKLYDKVSNLLDASFMSVEKRAKYNQYAAKLCDEVEAKYGLLNIVRMARAFTA